MNRRFLLVLFVMTTLSCSVWVGDKKIVGSVTATSQVATSTNLVAVKTTPLPTGTRTPVPAIVTAMRSLNVRQRAGDDQRVVGYLYSGEDVTLTGQCNSGWAEISWQDGTAWVNAMYLSMNKCSNE